MLFDEFYNQGDTEKSLGLEVAPFMDREQSLPSTAQQGFISFIVRPLSEAWCQFLPSASKVLLPRLAENLQQLESWESEEKRARSYGCQEKRNGSSEEKLEDDLVISSPVDVVIEETSTGDPAATTVSNGDGDDGSSSA